MVNKLIIQLVSNYVILPDVIDDAKVVVRERIQKEKDVPSGVDLEIRLESTLDVLIRIIKKENENDQGRRYGHPVVDIVRGINRYMHPQIHDVGRDKAKIDSIKNDFSQKLSEALGEINKISSGKTGDSALLNKNWIPVFTGMTKERLPQRLRDASQ